MIVWSGTIGIRNQFAYSTLLEGDTVSDQNNLGQLLLNKTSEGQTNEQGNTIQNQQDGQEQQSPGNDKAIDVIPKSTSDVVMQDLKDTQLIDRILPVIINKINLTIAHRDSGTVTILPSGVGINSQFYNVEADCKKNEIATGGGYKMRSAPFMYVPWSFKDGNSWIVSVWVPDNNFGPLKWPNNEVPAGHITVYVECLKLELK